MTRIEKPGPWLKGKTIDRVDDSAANCTTFYFTDGTACMMEAENLGHGLIGPIYYEIDPKKPAHTQ